MNAMPARHAILMLRAPKESCTRVAGARDATQFLARLSAAITVAANRRVAAARWVVTHVPRSQDTVSCGIVVAVARGCQTYGRQNEYGAPGPHLPSENV